MDVRLQQDAHVGAISLSSSPLLSLLPLLFPLTGNADPGTTSSTTPEEERPCSAQCACATARALSNRDHRHDPRNIFLCSRRGVLVTPGSESQFRSQGGEESVIRRKGIGELMRVASVDSKAQQSRIFAQREAVGGKEIH